MSKKSKTSEATLATQLAAGTQKHFASIAALMFAGGTSTPSQVVAQLVLLATLRSDAEAAKANVKVKLAAEKAQAPALHDLLIAYVAFVRATFSSASVLADFGLAPRKAATPLTVEQQAAAKAKRAATRKARGTMGKKEKLAVKGDVTGVAITPITAPAAQPAPAAATSSATAPSHSAS